MLLCSDLTPGLVVKLVLQLYTYIINRGVFYIYKVKTDIVASLFLSKWIYELVYDGGRT